MSSELSRQLEDFRVKQKVTPLLQKVSFLFDANKASGLDVLSLAIIARKSLLDLAEIEPSLAVFEDLFVGTDKSVEFLSQDEQVELQGRIKRLLSFLSAHFKTTDAQQCVEYLIQKYKIHVYNGEDMILMALPYHDTEAFASLIKTITFFKSIEKASASEARWMFLRNVYKSGSPLSRQALIKMCRSSQPVMTAIIENTIDSLKYGAYNQAQLSFVNVVLLEVLSEFSLINYDISIALFSLCRICFKAAVHCTSAFFVGLSLATHIVCVADVRDDALGILVSRAISACPAGKVHAVLMSLLVIVSRRRSLPQAAIDALSKLALIWPDQLESAVADCVMVRAEVSVLIKALAGDESLVGLITKARDYTVAQIQAAAAAPPPVISSEDQTEADAEESCRDDEEEQDTELDKARRILTGLITQGSTKERLAGVDQFAALPGATRYCIRLAAACDSVEALRVAMKNSKGDAGYVGTLISVLSQFKSSTPREIIEAAFAHTPKIIPGSISKVGEALGVPEAASLIALIRRVESDFTLSSKMWKTVAVVASGSAGKLATSCLVSGWRSELLGNNFCAHFLSDKAAVKSVCDRFIEFANNAKTTPKNNDRTQTVLGQLVASVVIPGNLHRQALTQLVQKSMNELPVSLRTELVALVIQEAPTPVLKKLNELSTGEIAYSDSTLIKAAHSGISRPSVEMWTLIKKLIESGLDLAESGPAISAALSAEVPAAVASAAWRCAGSWVQSVSVSESSQSVIKMLELVQEQLSEKFSETTPVMLEILLAVAIEVQESGIVESSLVASLISQMVLVSIKCESELADTAVITMQAAGETLLGSLEFNAAWTTVLQVMSALSKDSSEHALAVQSRCLILLSSLLARDELDSETVTSKQLGQVLLGLVELVPTSASTGSVIESWTDLAGGVSLTSVIEQNVTQFLLHCTLKKLDKFFRRLQQMSQNSDEKQALVLRVYASVCQQGGSAATLALLPLVSDDIARGLKSDSGSSKKRKRNMDLVIAALRAVSASCVEEIPEVNLSEFAEQVASVPGSVDDQSVVAEACIAVARVASAEQIKVLVKSLMGRTTDFSRPEVQKAVIKTVLSLWRSVGEAMVPAITEVTMFLNELFNSDDSEVAAATRQLVKEIDRVTGEEIGKKLSGKDDGVMSDE